MRTRDRHPRYVRAQIPTTPPLLGATGPLRWDLHSPRAKRAGWVYTGITHPSTHPLYPSLGQYRARRPARTSTCTVLMYGYGTTGTCTYDTFDLVLGEPRGVEYRRVSGSLTVFSTDPVLCVLHLIMTETGLWRDHSSEACGRSRIWSILRSILRLI